MYLLTCVISVIISAAITQNSGSASFDYICNYAKKVFLKRKEGKKEIYTSKEKRNIERGGANCNHTKFATTFHWSVDRKRGFTVSNRKQNRIKI